MQSTWAFSPVYTSTANPNLSQRLLNRDSSSQNPPSKNLQHYKEWENFPSHTHIYSSFICPWLFLIQPHSPTLMLKDLTFFSSNSSLWRLFSECYRDHPVLNMKMCHLDFFTRRNCFANCWECSQWTASSWIASAAVTLPKVMPGEGESGAHPMTDWGNLKARPFQSNSVQFIWTFCPQELPQGGDWGYKTYRVTDLSLSSVLPPSPTGVHTRALPSKYSKFCLNLPLRCQPVSLCKLGVVYKWSE